MVSPGSNSTSPEGVVEIRLEIQETEPGPTRPESGRSQSTDYWLSLWADKYWHPEAPLRTPPQTSGKCCRKRKSRFDLKNNNALTSYEKRLRGADLVCFLCQWHMEKSLNISAGLMKRNEIGVLMIFFLSGLFLSALKAMRAGHLVVGWGLGWKGEHEVLSITALFEPKTKQKICQYFLWRLFPPPPVFSWAWRLHDCARLLIDNWLQSLSGLLKY